MTDWTPPTRDEITQPSTRDKVGAPTPTHPITGEPRTEAGERRSQRMMTESEQERHDAAEMARYRKEAREEQRTFEKISRSVRPCRETTCQAPMFWATSPQGRPMPMNYLAEKEPGPGQYEIKLGADGALLAIHISKEEQQRGIVGRTSHFATCVKAKTFRKGGR